MKITVSHSGKQHAYRHAYSVQALGCLERFVTSSYYRRDRWPDRFLSALPRMDRALQKRWLGGLDSTKVFRHPWLELPEIWQRNIRGNRAKAEQAMFRRDARFDRWVASKYAGDAEVFWGFQGSCLDSLRAAKVAGCVSVCEFATAHVASAIRILSEEAEKHPEWAGTISNFDFPNWYRERLEQEPFEADVCVAASSFTRESLCDAGVDPQRIRMLPLALDTAQFSDVRRTTSGPLKVLFVGGIGQRKGIKYLLQAIKQIQSKSVQLRLLGPLPRDDRPLRQWENWYEYLGQTDQDGVVRQMQQADVLVLPSVFEGFGLVIVEAMATGMPVIASTHTCAPEVVREGIDGFVLRPDDVESLAQKLAWCAENRKNVVQMGRSARQRALEFSWEQHSIRLGSLLNAL